MTVLITGFEPFGGQSVNPSWEAVSALPDRVGSCCLEKLRLPVEYGEAARRVLERARELSPQAILCVGQAGGRDAVTPEVIGINLREASIPDNAGAAPAGTPIDPQGPDGIFSTLPVREMVSAILARGIPSRLSYSAGAYVCNDLMYTLLNHFRGTDTRVGFLHVPYIPAQGSPSLPQAQLTQALTAAIEIL
ncbi:MAG: pyroglutamyl-peptidase I [Faecousia sp.]